jgi:hypothetical protein
MLLLYVNPPALSTHWYGCKVGVQEENIFIRRPLVSDPWAFCDILIDPAHRCSSIARIFRVLRCRTITSHLLLREIGMCRTIARRG